MQKKEGHTKFCLHLRIVLVADNHHIIVLILIYLVVRVLRIVRVVVVVDILERGHIREGIVGVLVWHIRPNMFGLRRGLGNGV